VVAPALFLKKAHRMKANRRDAVSSPGCCARVSVPDSGMRLCATFRAPVKERTRICRAAPADLAVDAAAGTHLSGKKTWGSAHINWLTAQKLEHREQRTAFEEL
jgi:hypothetical protein